MIHRTTHGLKRSISLVVAACATTLLLCSTVIAQEITLLILEPDLISELDDLAGDATAVEIIKSYYQQLPPEAQLTLNQYDELLDKLIVEYEVARTAADSAEITEVISDMDATWIEIQKVHSDAFTSKVTQILDDAYSEVYPVL